MPPVQQFVGNKVAQAISGKLGTKVKVGKVNLGFLNRVIIDDVMIFDQQGDSLLYASRLSVKADYLPLTQGQISISSAQLFGLKANLYKTEPTSKPNFQFVLDSLASKDTTKHTPLHLHIGSLILRRGAVAWNERYVSEKPTGVFSTHHLKVSGLSTHIILDKATDDELNVYLKKLSLKELHSGLDLRALSFRLTASRSEAILHNFRLQLPHSVLALDDLQANYKITGGKNFYGGHLDTSSLHFTGGISESRIHTQDIAPLLPMLKGIRESVNLRCSVEGNYNSLHCPQLVLSTSGNDIVLQARGNVRKAERKGTGRSTLQSWNTSVQKFSITPAGLQLVTSIIRSIKHSSTFQLPQQLLQLGKISLTAEAKGNDRHLQAQGRLATDAGKANFTASKDGSQMKASVQTPGFDLGRVLQNKALGQIAGTVKAQGTKDNLTAQAKIDKVDYNGYHLQGIQVDGRYANGTVSGKASVSDPSVNVKGTVAYNTRNSLFDIDAYIARLQPSVLGLKAKDKTYRLQNIHISASNKGSDSHIDLEAPFMSLYARGQYNVKTVYNSAKRILAQYLPSLPGIGNKGGKKSGSAGAFTNDFTLQANITSTEPLQRMLGISLQLDAPVHLTASLSEQSHDMHVYLQAPAFTYKSMSMHNVSVEANTLDDSLTVDAHAEQGRPGATAPVYTLHAKAADNELSTLLYYDNHSTKLPIKGKLDALTEFATTKGGSTEVGVTVHPSEVMLGDTQWNVHPATVTYRKNELTVDSLSLSHAAQHITLNGKATPSPNDSIVADLKDVDVAYILNLVNFHSVEFAGYASGQAVAKNILQKPDVYGLLDISHFTFENGPLGTLHTGIAYDNEEGQINIKGKAEDGDDHLLYVDGYVSLRNNYIDLGMDAQNTSLKFMETYCDSFMDDVKAWGSGHLNVVGDLSNIQLLGDVTAHGSVHMKQLDTYYSFNRLKAHAVTDDIIVKGDTLYDSHYTNGSNGHYGIANGGIHHQHLTNLSYDLYLQAHNFLGFDTKTFGENTFYGTVYATGKVGIHGKSGETVIDIDGSPEPGSVFVYNVASPEDIGESSFIHWHDVTPYIYRPLSEQKADADNDADDVSSDIKINFLVNTTPNLTMKLIMDEQTNDYITLQGNGVIRASYFNKGSLDMFGNYVVDNGVYKLTIQNVIKKSFELSNGGTISFGGDPYNAPLNLQAKYTVTGVPLSDLNIGNSFSSNNIRVDCLMNITGTPGSPKVDFTMDLPTVNNDAKQMIYSVINSQEEMNQQVLYLLGIGRFYTLNKNNQNTDGSSQSETSLAMQSLLSGTISQQINSVLSTVVKSKNWNFGANIATGNDGFMNAEYEGLLSGRLLNNRLIFNGQFGYRDNINTTQNFIGDFDLRYLIFPNGNLSIHVYNQANDRYFTPSSLNTQGLGITLKKDFSTLWDLFGIKRKKK